MKNLMQPWVDGLSFEQSMTIQNFFRFRINSDSRNLIALRNWMNRRLMLSKTGASIDHPAIECGEEHLPKSYADPDYYRQCLTLGGDIPANKDYGFIPNMGGIVRQAHRELIQYRFKYVTQFLRCIKLLSENDSIPELRSFWATLLEDYTTQSGIEVK